MANQSEQLISAIRVEDLFGLYTYRLPQEGMLPNAAILYGDNGIGKTTILRLAFHLLSAANNRGHRGALYQSNFTKLEVILSSGVILLAARKELKGRTLLDFLISKNGKPIAQWMYMPQQQRELFLGDEAGYSIEIGKDGTPRVSLKSIRRKEQAIAPEGEDLYLSALKDSVPTTFFLNAERRLDSDSVSDPSDEMELRRVMRYEEPKRINDLIGRSREIALSQALKSASDWVRAKAFQGANKGASNVHSVYVDVLHHLITPSPSAKEAAPVISPAELIKKLGSIESRTAELAQYELATILPTTEFKKALQTRSQKKRNLAAELLNPYVKSLESRLDAVEPTYSLVDRFVRIINGFLRDKSLSFQQRNGFVIQSKLGTTLQPSELSSGEQQLLLLFSYVLTAREKPSVFIIDEPEISLNIKWQRQLVQSLLDITAESSTQFIFASHSMELLAQHRNRVIPLINVK